VSRTTTSGAKLLDDTYNASPAALAAGLAVLAEESGARWLVLGDMAELGALARDFHRDAGAQAAAAGVERLFTLGALARAAGETFPYVHQHAEDRAALEAALSAALARAAGTPVALLVKGSRVMGLDRVVAALCAPETCTC
jgi:UDP-N-acetylmuramoyl-tripeptide--D-alanyl-D-alanine ligase